jgi:hypothetical protein
MSKSIPNAVVKFAEARAAGSSWQAAARESGWSLDGLRRWIRKHPAAWYRELFRARRDARDSACDEAVAMLRVQLRDEEPKTKFEAANAVAKHFASGKVRKHAARSTKNDETSSESGVIQFSITESELAELEKEFQTEEEERRLDSG